jgi:hypothetical protein
MPVGPDMNVGCLPTSYFDPILRVDEGTTGALAPVAVETPWVVTLREILRRGSNSPKRNSQRNDKNSDNRGHFVSFLNLIIRRDERRLWKNDGEAALLISPSKGLYYRRFFFRPAA